MGYVPFLLPETSCNLLTDSFILLFLSIFHYFLSSFLVLYLPLFSFCYSFPSCLTRHRRWRRKWKWKRKWERKWKRKWRSGRHWQRHFFHIFRYEWRGCSWSSYRDNARNGWIGYCGRRGLIRLPRMEKKTSFTNHHYHSPSRQIRQPTSTPLPSRPLKIIIIICLFFFFSCFYLIYFYLLFMSDFFLHSQVP